MGCSASSEKEDDDVNFSKRVSNRISERMSQRLQLDDSEIEHTPAHFRILMDDKACRKAFMEFLEEEHAEENFLFFEEVEKLKHKPEDDLAKNFKNLANSYIAPNVEAEVNISDNLRNRLLGLVGKDSASVRVRLNDDLDKAQNEVLMMMALGSFPRFLKSDFFADYKRKKACATRAPERTN